MSEVRLLPDRSIVVPSHLVLGLLNELVRQWPCNAKYRKLRDAHLAWLAEQTGVSDESERTPAAAAPAA